MVGDDGTFIIFSDMSWGTRALGQSLINMINKGYSTIATLIPQWSATDQAAYIVDVSSDTGIDQNATLGTDSQTITLLIRAICNQENGDTASYDYVTDQDIADGIAKINSGLITTLQAVAVDAANYPMPYLAGGILLILGIWYWYRPKKKSRSS